MSSPLPWRLSKDGPEDRRLITDGDGCAICEGYIDAEAAEFIVKAVNSHAKQQERIEELERALTGLIAIVDDNAELSAGFRSTILWFKDVCEGAKTP